VHDIIDSLFTFPATSIPQAAEMLGIQYAPEREHFRKLVEVDILDANPVMIGNTKFYLARGIIRTVEAPLGEEVVPDDAVAAIAG
jgi:hypothetical protein